MTRDDTSLIQHYYSRFSSRVSLRIADAQDGSRALFCLVIINFCLCSMKDNKT